MNDFNVNSHEFLNLKGFHLSIQKGCLTGNKVIGVRFVLTDGANHAVTLTKSRLYKL
jgi:translation elongation factor EF-G